MPRSRIERPSVFCAVACALIALAAGPARAASMPLHAEVGVGARIDVAAFERSVASRYHVAFRKVVAADIDRDGDIDIVAATERTVTVWVNDGSGHLSTRAPRHASDLEGRRPQTTWRASDRGADETVQDDLPSVPFLIAYAHAPPTLAVRAASPSQHVPWLDACRGVRSPRAPPA